jgi:type II pantothenate kinase
MSSQRRFYEFLGIAAVSLGVVLFTRWRLKNELRQRRSNKKMGSLNIGGIFGMDVGGTLTKIVYFERTTSRPPAAAPIPPAGAGTGAETETGAGTGGGRKDQAKGDAAEDPLASPAPSPAKLKRVCSIDRMDTPAHIAALDEMHRYMGETKSYASVDDGLNFYSSLLGGRMHFLRFETRLMTTAIETLSTTGVTQNIRTIGCTGGGAHKYAQAISDQLDITVQETDEMECLIRGMHFAIMNIPAECYTYRSFGNALENEKLEWIRDVKEVVRKITVPVYPTIGGRRDPNAASQFPYLIVNIGSGVSILKVSSTDKYERVSGSSLGGGTYWGLCRLFTRCSSFEEAMDMAETGDSKQIDMLVRDIYGGSYSNMNLDGDMVASSFGKLVMKENPREGLKEEDLAIALLMMITNNIGQVAYLNAKLHGCRRIFFAGSFLRHNAVSCRRLAFAINFWSKATMDALFLEHDGYFGAIGTFLQSAFGDDVDKILMMSQGESKKEKSPLSHSLNRPRAQSIDSLNVASRNHGSAVPPEEGPGAVDQSVPFYANNTSRSSDNIRNTGNKEPLDEEDEEDEEGGALRFVRRGVHTVPTNREIPTIGESDSDRTPVSNSVSVSEASPQTQTRTRFASAGSIESPRRKSTAN